MSDIRNLLIWNDDRHLDSNILMTGLPRDIHLAYPQQYRIDVRTTAGVFAELWYHNPHISPIADNDSDAIVLHFSVDDASPLTNQRTEHVLQRTYESISQQLDRSVRPAFLYGDIHRSSQELALRSLTHELTGKHIPYWLITNGYDDDADVRAWDQERFERVVKHFRGRIAFVQIGTSDQSHKPIAGTINLIDKLSLRAQMHLMTHADGLISTVSPYLYLSAAIPFQGTSHDRPCIVISGGRKSPNDFAFPSHQVLHTIGALSCCAAGGCGRRYIPSANSATKDAALLCVQPVDDIAKCMDMISSYQVIETLERCYRGDLLRYISAEDQRLLSTAVAKTKQIVITGFEDTLY